MDDDALSSRPRPRIDPKNQFATSADGRLQGFPRMPPPPEGFPIPRRPVPLSASQGAMQGVSPQLAPTPPHGFDVIGDAISLYSSGSGKQKMLSIEETDLVAGRFDASASSSGFGRTSSLPVSSTRHGHGAGAPSAAASSSLDSTSREGLALGPPAPTRVGKKGEKKNETEKEKLLRARMKELQSKLDLEQHRKKEQAKASHDVRASRGRLVVCTPRLPYRIERNDDGRLVVGAPSSRLAAYEHISRLDVTWVGCPGGDEEIGDDEKEGLAAELREVGCVPVYVDPGLLAEAEGISGEVLWPLFHYIPLSMLDCDTDVIHQRWPAYEAVNAAYTRAVVAQKMTAGDLVWVHDFQLMVLPRMLREALPKLKIGWFLHTPFPSSEIYQTLPLRKEIMRGVLAADLVGFQIYDYVRHFMNACSRVLSTDINVDSKYILDAPGSMALADGKTRTAVAVDAFPSGIDQARFERMLSSPELHTKLGELERRFDGKRLILGVDRIDYVKGIPHKLLAFEKFLHNNPQEAGKLILVQIAPPPKKDTVRYQKLRNKVHKLVGRINGRFGTLEHAPIHY